MIAELRATPLVTFGHISLLRRYIGAKYPDLPLPQSTAILADAVNKIVEKKIAAIGETYRPQIKTNLFRMIAKRRYFQINAGDVLEASLPLEWSEEFLQAELCQWVNQMLRKAVPLDKLAGLLTKLAKVYRQKSGRNLETLAGEIDGKGAPVRLNAKINDRVTSHIVRAGQIEAPRKPVVAARVAPVAALQPAPKLPEEKALAWAVWESIESDAPRFFEDSESREVARPWLETPDPEAKDAAAEAERRSRFRPGKALLAGAAAAVITVMLMFSFLGALLSNRAVLASGAAVSARSEKAASLTQLSDEIAQLEQGFETYQETASRNAALAEQVKQVVAGGAPPSGAAGAAEDRVFVATVSEQHPSNNSNAVSDGADLKALIDDAYLMKATAYDLSVGSCGKTPDDPLYGITRSGVKARYGRTIAVDPSVVPLGSKVKLTFPDHYSYLDGVYFAEDTGSAIKGNRIDLFMGEDQPGEKFVYDDAMKFGIQQVRLQILR